MKNFQHLVWIVLLSLIALDGMAGGKHWTGDVSSDWEDAANWKEGLPGDGDDVIIDSTGEYTGAKVHPVITDSSSFTVGAVLIQNGGKLYIDNDLSASNNFQVLNNYVTTYSSMVVMTGGDVYVSGDKNLEMKFNGKFYMHGGNLYVSKELKLEEGGYFYMDTSSGPATVYVNYDQNNKGKLKMKGKSGYNAEFNLYAGNVYINAGETTKEIEMDGNGEKGASYALLNIEGGNFTNYGSISLKNDDLDSTPVRISGGILTIHDQITAAAGKGHVDIEITGGEAYLLGDITLQSTDQIINTGGRLYFNGTQTINSDGIISSDDSLNITTDVIFDGSGGRWQFGDIYIQPGASLTQSSTDTLKLSGNWINTGTYTSGSAAVEFNGSSDQYLYNSNGETFYDLVMNKTSGDLIVDTTNTITINGNLALIKGHIVGDTLAPCVTFTDAATFSGFNWNSYIDAKVAKTGSSAFVFPIGNTYRPARIGISAPTSSSTFEAYYGIGGFWFFDRKEAGLNNVSTFEHWILSRTAGTGSAAVTLYWESGIWNQIQDLSQLVVAHFSGGQWNNETQSGGVTGDTLIGTVTSQQLSSFSPFTFGSDGHGNNLPIELLSFTADAHNNVVDLNWATAVEINCKEYVVERSTDGIDYQPILQVDGAGNSSLKSDYSITDHNPETGYNYYRLKQIDYDGAYEYYGPESAYISNTSAEPTVSIHPNPATGNHIGFTLSGFSSAASLQVMDATGAVIWQGQLNDLNENGHNTTDLPVSLQPGYYFAVVQSTQTVVREKFLVIK